MLYIVLCSPTSHQVPGGIAQRTRTRHTQQRQGTPRTREKPLNVGYPIPTQEALVQLGPQALTTTVLRNWREPQSQSHLTPPPPSQHCKTRARSTPRLVVGTPFSLCCLSKQGEPGKGKRYFKEGPGRQVGLLGPIYPRGTPSSLWALWTESHMNLAFHC